MATVEFHECPGCGARVATDMQKCEYCGGPVVIRSISVLRDFSPLQLNKYASSYRKQLTNDPNDRELNRSMGICYLKLKLYDKADEAFERANTENFDDAQSYFYAAIGKLQGKKAFVTPRPEIDKAVEYLNAANMIAPDPVYYLMLAYIKKDYFSRKALNISPTWKEESESADLMGATSADIDSLTELLGVPVCL